MRSLAAVVVLLAAFSGVLLWRTLSPRPAAPPARVPPTAEPRERAGAPAAVPAASASSLRLLLEITGPRGKRHTLLTRSSNHGLYYRSGEGDALPLDPGAEIGKCIDLSVSADGRAWAAYCDARTGEVRFAAPDRTPRPWIGLRRLRRPSRCTLTADRIGVLVSYYDEETGELFYSYLARADGSWRHGVAGREGSYRVVTGRPGAFVLRK
jgi:hypothetical protein